MVRFLLKFSWVFVMAALSTFSCTKDATTNSGDVENFVSETVYAMQERGNCGRGGCFEFVFPLTVEFPDATTSEVNSYEELKSTVRAWKEANPDAEERPVLAFPIEVISEEGDVISVSNEDELRDLRQECRRNFPGPGHHGGGRSCFTIVFPLDILFPDGTIAEATDRRTLKTLVREWKSNNPDSEERPELVFPIEVELEDGTTVTVEDKDALIALKESCN